MKRIFDIIFCCILIAGCSSSSVSPRERMDFNGDWTFNLGDVPEASDPEFDDSGWRKLDLPHDWAVEGDFSQDAPSGTGGGALPGGTGWYRKTFFVPEEQSDMLWRLDFDGVYMNAEVFVNGVSLGVRPYGYISFGYDISPLLKWDAENVVAVRVDNSEQPNSRWYSGCGIYRNVWLTKTEKVRVAPNGTYVYTCAECHNAGAFQVHTSVLAENDQVEKVNLRQILMDADGNEVARVEEVVNVADISEWNAGILDVKEKLENRAKQEFAQANMKLEAEKAKLLELQKRRNSYMEVQKQEKYCLRRTKHSGRLQIESS